jgi:HK97 family phage prohead protease
MEARMAKEKYQERELQTQIRAARAEDGAMVAAGLAVPYNVETVLWSDDNYEEREIIAAGAFAQSIEELDQVALWMHQRDMVLGRKSAGTLALAETAAGVTFEITFPQSPEGESKFTNVQRGDVNAMSFGWRDQEVREEFYTTEEKRIYKRTVIRGALREVSPVSFAAYEGATSIQARDSQDISNVKERIDSELEATAEGGNAAAAAERAHQLRDMQLKSIGGTHGKITR